MQHTSLKTLTRKATNAHKVYTKNMTSIKAQHYIQLFKMDTVLVITEESTGDASIIIYVITIHGQTTRNMSEFC